ncbi:MAG: type II toxin-antitoxin system RelE/ParE family toxin [Devosia sp.]
MPHLRWSPRAIRDLGRLQDFLQSKSAGSAGHAIETIQRQTAPLEQFPGIGRPVANLPARYRDLFVQFGDSGYVVRYEVRRDAVLIVGVRHMREAGF